MYSVTSLDSENFWSQYTWEHNLNDSNKYKFLSLIHEQNSVADKSKVSHMFMHGSYVRG